MTTPDSSPAFDPRDPRGGATEPHEFVDEGVDALVPLIEDGEGLRNPATRAAAAELLVGLIKRFEEAEILRYIGTGMSAEDAAAQVDRDRAARLARLESTQKGDQETGDQE